MLFIAYSFNKGYNEPTTFCIIKQKVEEGLINKKRYESYIRMLSDIIDVKNF